MDWIVSRNQDMPCGGFPDPAVFSVSAMRRATGHAFIVSAKAQSPWTSSGHGAAPRGTDCRRSSRVVRAAVYPLEAAIPFPRCRVFRDWSIAWRLTFIGGADQRLNCIPVQGSGVPVRFGHCQISSMGNSRFRHSEIP